MTKKDESYSCDYALGRTKSANGTNGTNFDTNLDSISTLRNFSDEESAIINLIRVNVSITQGQIQEKTNYSLRTVKRVMAKLQKDGIITRIGNNRSGKWQVNE